MENPVYNEYVMGDYDYYEDKEWDYYNHYNEDIEDIYDEYDEDEF
jgi:hypothetical protein